MSTVAEVQLPELSQWGHRSPAITPGGLIEHLGQQAVVAVQDYSILPEEDPCDAREGYKRVSVAIPVCEVLFDQLLNGATGYRAHYASSIEVGEKFNRRLVEAIAPIIVRAEDLYKGKFDSVFCNRSLLGSFSKFWFPKELTDPSAAHLLSMLKPELRVPRWLTYWRHQPKPWKGLLAPLPENPSVLLNGTFVDDAGQEYEQKPDRSKQLFDSGWT